MIKGFLISYASAQILLIDITITVFAKCNHVKLLDNRSLSHLQNHLNNSDEKENANHVPEDILNFHKNVSHLSNRAEHDSSWFENIPALPSVFVMSKSHSNGTCKADVQQYLRELQRGTLWAVQMYDASSKYPDGIISGHTRHFGNFDQCYRLQASVPNDEEGTSRTEISGRYCLVDLEFQKKNISSSAPESYSLIFDPNESAWEAIREKGDFRRVKRYKLQMALCVPASCSAADVAEALKEPLEQIGLTRNISILTSVKREFCQALSEAPAFSTAAKIYCFILVALFLLVIISSWYDNTLDINQDKGESVTRDLLLCFSAQRNFKSLLETKYNHPGLDCVYSIRFISMCLVIYGHRIMQYCSNPTINSDYFEMAYSVPVSVILFNGTIIVEAFFGIGGLLFSYALLEELDKRRNLNLISLILIRFIRFTPLYVLVIFFNVLILPYLGSGPYWEAKIGLDRDCCAYNWWTNILYINNYVNTKSLCMFQSWYLAVDYQLYIVALFVVYVFWRWPRNIGYSFLSFLIVVSAAVTFVITYKYSLPPLFAGFPYMREIRDISYFIEQYVKTHMRATSYFVGIVAGAIVYDYKGATWRLPKMWSQALFILLVVALSIAAQFLGFKYFVPNAKLYPIETALYASLHRGVFAFSVCCIIILITIGDGLDFHYKILTPRWMQPLSKLTYSAYLVHNINQSYDIGVARTARTFAFHNFFWDFVPDIVYTFALSLVLSIVVEGPFRKIEKRFITKRTRTDSVEMVSSKMIKKVK